MLDLEGAVNGIPQCWLLKLSRPWLNVHLGKFGDLMISLPAMKAVHDQTGVRPICMVSNEYASIFDGVSYVQPWVVNLHWWMGVGQARKMAMAAGYQPTVWKWWDEPGVAPPMKLANGKTITLTIHGVKRVLPAAEWDSFQASQWRYAGFTMEQMMQWPLVFDRRDPGREQVLRTSVFHTPQPKLLVNFSNSGTSPFRNIPQAYSMCLGQGMEVVDLASVRATRIYDLLGLYDHAAGLVTTDTATLHLAVASNLPYIALINNGGAGSIPKGNCILALRYSEFMPRLGRYREAIQKLAGMAAVPA